MPELPVGIAPVATRRDLREFVRLPFRLYREDPGWVPPLISQQKAFLDPRKNPFFAHAEVALWLARRGGRVVGRITSHIDHLSNRTHDENLAMFGFFEAEDESVAEALLDQARDWARARGAAALRGPLSFSTNHECGLLVEGFDEQPSIMLPHSSPRYPGFMERCGLAKEMDLLCYRLRRSDVDGDPDRLPPRLLRLGEQLAKRARVTVRRADPTRYREEFLSGFAVFNSAWAGNWGFVPATDRELEWFARELKPIVDPRLCLFAEVDGTTVGFVLTAADFNQVLVHLRGRLLPSGWITALRRRRAITGARVLLFGVHEAYQGRGAEALLFLELLREALRTSYQMLDLAWILETNDAALRPLLTVGAPWELRPNRRYRIYRQSLTRC